MALRWPLTLPRLMFNSAPTTPNVLLTPHTAGHGPYLDDRRLEVLLDNARRFGAGQPLRNVVDKARWF